MRNKIKSLVFSALYFLDFPFCESGALVLRRCSRNSKCHLLFGSNEAPATPPFSASDRWALDLGLPRGFAGRWERGIYASKMISCLPSFLFAHPHPPSLSLSLSFITHFPNPLFPLSLYPLTSLSLIYHVPFSRSYSTYLIKPTVGFLRPLTVSH